MHCSLITGDLLIDFEGIGNLNPVNGFYGGVVTFSDNALAIVDSDAGGSGNFGGEPSPSAALFFLSGAAAVVSLPGGFSTGFSFWYSSISNTGETSAKI